MRAPARFAIISAVDPMPALLEQLERGELGDPLPVLAYLAGRAVEVPDGELNESLAARCCTAPRPWRRSSTRASTSTSPRAVKAIALDLFTAERRDQLAHGIDRLVLDARDLAAVRDAALFLAADLELAWRLYALALLAEEIGG